MSWWWFLPVSLAFAADPDPALGSARDSAERVRLEREMSDLARRSAWSAVDRDYREIEALGGTDDPEVHELGADASRALGDAWGAYQRLLRVITLAGPDAVAHDVMQAYRDGYGRVIVRRVELTPIALAAAAPPFAPEHRAAIEWASGQLAATGGFDGMLPVGSYALGPYTVTVDPGLDPKIVQRTVGDGTPTRKARP